jgi:adenine-specific DNA-methyltransferase
MHVRAQTKSVATSSERDPRRLGAYYTPDSVAAILTKWALPSGRGCLLDPSFGGCSFLRAGVALGQALSGQVEVFGVDIDTEASVFADQLHAMGVPRSHISLTDFFGLSREELMGELFADAIVGNPPYIRHHWQTTEDRDLAKVRSASVGLNLSARADLWCHFVGHSLSFLRTGGRLAFLLPIALLYADYAQPVLEFLATRFESVRLIELEDRLFPEAAEGTVVVAAMGHRDQGIHRIFLGCSSVRGLELALTTEGWGKSVKVADRRLWNLLAIPVEGRLLVEQLAERPDVRSLGSLARIRIGIVTGSNQFFIRRYKEVAEHSGEGVTWHPIVTRAAQLRMANFAEHDCDAFRHNPHPSYLLVSRPSENPPLWLSNDIKMAEGDFVHTRSHCARRDVWYELGDTRSSDALLPYMGARPVRPVTNAAGILSTNAVHRVWWKDASIDPRAIIVGSWTSLYALSAEVHGRRYGGGVLKLEPSEACRLLVPVAATHATAVFEDLDSFVRNGDFDSATALADEVVLCKGLKLSTKSISTLRDAAEMLRRFRTSQPQASD